MSTVAKIGIATALISGAVYGIVHATKSANAASKLLLDIDSVHFAGTKKSGSIPVGVVYNVKVKISNPTSTDIEASQPFIVISTKKKDGTLSRIANTSEPSNELLKIPAKKSIVVSHNLEVRTANTGAIASGIFQYISSRINGEKSTQKVVVDTTIDAMGLTFSTQEIINL